MEYIKAKKKKTCIAPTHLRKKKANTPASPSRYEITTVNGDQAWEDAERLIRESQREGRGETGGKVVSVKSKKVGTGSAGSLAGAGAGAVAAKRKVDKDGGEDGDEAREHDGGRSRKKTKKKKDHKMNEGGRESGRKQRLGGKGVKKEDRVKPGRSDN